MTLLILTISPLVFQDMGFQFIIILILAAIIGIFSRILNTETEIAKADYYLIIIFAVLGILSFLLGWWLLSEGDEILSYVFISLGFVAVLMEAFNIVNAEYYDDVNQIAAYIIKGLLFFSCTFILASTQIAFQYADPIMAVAFHALVGFMSAIFGLILYTGIIVTYERQGGWIYQRTTTFGRAGEGANAEMSYRVFGMVMVIFFMSFAYCMIRPTLDGLGISIPFMVLGIILLIWFGLKKKNPEATLFLVISGIAIVVFSLLFPLGPVTTEAQAIFVARILVWTGVIMFFALIGMLSFFLIKRGVKK